MRGGVGGGRGGRVIPVVPKVISLPGRMQLLERNRELEHAVVNREEAHQLREQLAAVVESSDDAIISKTLDGTITAWNRGAQKVFGYAPSEAVGKPMLMLMPPERANEEPEILARLAH